MTTMFVQLRRVVYLLVLYQCCFCGVNAEEETWLTRAEHRVKSSLERADSLRVRGESCLSGWKEQVKANNDSYKAAQKTIEGTKALIKVIEKVTGKVKVFEGSGNKDVLSEVDKLVERARKELGDSNKVLQKARASVNNTKLVKTFCVVERENLEDVKKELENNIYFYDEALQDQFGDNRTTDNEEKQANLKHALEKVTGLINDIKKYAGENQLSLFDAGVHIKAAEDEIGKATGGLRSLEAEVKGKKQTFAVDEGMFNKTVEGIGNASKDSKVKTKGIERTLTVGDFNKTLRAEMEKGFQRLAQEKVELVKMRAKERAREEQERRAREERERIAREEQERLAAEKARQAKEEKQRVAAEEERRAKEAAEKAKKKRDGSNSPTLVQCSLLLILLCLLGCTLVC